MKYEAKPPFHDWRYSDSSQYDAVCRACNITDEDPRATKPCIGVDVDSPEGKAIIIDDDHTKPRCFLDTVDRKSVPLATGLFDYFPDALAAVAHCSHVANEQHNPGEPVHWDRDKSRDHDNTLLRHFSQRGTYDVDGVRHRAKVAWRALAALQIEIEESLKNAR